ncbi:MAG: 50S ribosomal protein L18 [Candidatus Nanohaloarchaea archaeon]|nr:50S ribosomal protein L18 [Candidatus Nanohaloarchaea archaeon]
MAKGPAYKLPHRRRREKKTDYKKRLELIKSGKPRAVVRISNQHARVQIVGYSREGDQVISSAFSGQLEDFGWKHHTGNMPAAYLTGFLAGTRGVNEGIEEAVVDIGLQNNQYGTTIYAAVKGVQDAGIEADVDEKAFPEEGRLKGEHIDEYKDKGVVSNVEEVKEEIESM